MSTYEVVSCDRFGNNSWTHADARFTEPIRDELNGEGGFSFTVPVRDRHIDQLEPWKREVQVYRKTDAVPPVPPTLVYWGVIANTDLEDLRVKKVEVGSLFHYFTRRTFGKAGRGNALINGSFDVGGGTLAPWTAQGVTANIVTAWGMRPGATYQLNLYQGGSGDDTFVTQTIAVTGGQLWTISADFHIRTDSQWVGPAIEGRGLYVERFDPTGTVLEDVASFAITDDTPRGEFQRATVTMTTPPNRNSFFRVRLYATRCTAATGSPPGSIIWDNAKVTLMESLSFPLADVGSVANQIVAHAQDPVFGKDDLNIAQGSPTNTGIRTQRVYQFMDHQVIGDAFKELADQGVCDFGFTWSDANHRAFRIYAPKAGAVRTDITLEYGAGRGIKSVPNIRTDGSKTASSIIVVSQNGSGPDRDEAAAIDTTSTGGVVIEDVISSNENYDILYQVAEIALAAKKRPVQVPELVVSPALVGQVNVGDTIPVVIKQEAVNIDANYRIVATELDPSTDTFKVTVNLA